MNLLSMAVLSLALLGASAPHTSRHSVSGWIVKIETDGFTGRVGCRIFRGPVVVRDGVAQFQFNRRRDTSAADYRIDGGPSARVTISNADMLTDDLARLDNPSNGVVKIPVSQLFGAHHVAIRPISLHAPHVFDIAGLGDALAYAEAHQCPAAPDRR